MRVILSTIRKCSLQFFIFILSFNTIQTDEYALILKQMLISVNAYQHSLKDKQISILVDRRKHPFKKIIIGKNHDVNIRLKKMFSYY